jgi:hypothetical protein
VYSCVFVWFLKQRLIYLYSINCPVFVRRLLMFNARYGLNLYRVSQEECARLRENVPNVKKVHRYNPKHLYPKLNGYGDNGQRSLKV